jgi:hypothetical protein
MRPGGNSFSAVIFVRSVSTESKHHLRLAFSVQSIGALLRMSMSFRSIGFSQRLASPVDRSAARSTPVDAFWIPSRVR